MAIRVSPDHVEVDSATTKRARGYLRWYPLRWRVRYGEEFVAHLEVELTERPVSFARSFDIAAHGVLARFSLQRGLRLALQVATALLLIIAVTIGAIGLSHYWAPVTISSGYEGGVTGVGEFAPPSQVNDVSFNFSTRAHVAVRITSVKVIPVQGFAAPKLVGAEFAPHVSELANVRGWPIRLPKGTTVQAQGKIPPVEAIGRTVTLSRSDALWLGLRAPTLGHAYAVEGVQLTYSRRGVSHTMTIHQSSAPDVICASSSRSAQIPLWCSQEIQAATTMATFSSAHHTAAKIPSDEAQMVASLALSELQASGHGTPRLSDVRQWAAQLFPATTTNGIVSVSGIANVGTTGWRFVIRKASSHSLAVICTNRGLVDSGGGMIGVGVESCHSQS